MLRSGTSRQTGPLAAWRANLIFQARISFPLLHRWLLRRVSTHFQERVPYAVARATYSTTRCALDAVPGSLARTEKPSGGARSGPRAPRPLAAGGAHPAAAASGASPRYRPKAPSGARGGSSPRGLGGGSGGLQFADMLRDLHYLKAEGAIDGECLM
jgi:hypothetical protein